MHRLALITALALAPASGALSQEAAGGEWTVIKTHAISLFDEPALPADFPHYRYVNPDAPKGGEISFGAVGGFDSFNPFTHRGRAIGLSVIQLERLMDSPADELGVDYCLLCETVEYPESRDWVIFNLRPEATFSDGTPLTAEDAVFSISRYLGLEGGELEPTLGQARLQAAIAGLEVVDDHQFRLSFNVTGSATLLSDLAANPGAAPGFIVPKHVVEELGDVEFNANPVGTGPFTLVSNEPGLSMAFEANPDYWGEGPYVQRVEFSAVSDLTTRMSQLTVGEADIIDAVSGPAIGQLQGSGDVELVESRMATNQWIAVGGQTNPDSPLSHVEVRQALSQAIDREAVVDVLLGGLGAPSFLFSFPASIGFPTEAAESLTRPYDPEAARALLATAGFSDGFDLELVAVPTGSEMANAIAQNWREIGINTTVNVLEQGELLADLQSEDRKLETRVVLMSTVGMPYRAEIGGTWGTHLNGGAVYGQPFANPRVGELVVEQASATDPAARNVLIEELLTLAFEEQVNIPVWYASSIFGVGPQVESWDIPDGSTYVINLATLRLAD